MPTEMSSSDLLDGGVRELILLAGKDGVGKSSAVVSLAWYVEQVEPAAAFYVLDTENKFRSAMRAFGSDAPRNIRYYKCDTMNDVTLATDAILDAHKPGDWLGVESLSRVWERAQDLAYQAQAGVTKVEYLERKRKAPLPGNPGDFWAIAKGAHDGAFMDRITACTDLNVIATTTVTKPRDGGYMKESADRKAVRVELGIDVGLDGAPRIPYYVETMALLELKGGAVTCRMLRDNNSTAEVTRVEFDVPGKRDWAVSFYGRCRT